MTQIQPTSEPSTERVESEANPKDSNPTSTDPTSIEPESKPEAIPDSHTKEATPADDHFEQYRPPEAVPLPKGDIPVVEDNTWGDTNNQGWGVDQDNNDWGGGNNWLGKFEQWGPVQPSADQWKNLGVIGTDDPSRDSERWWDPEVQRNKRKPGPGMLAPRAIELIHDSDHTLYEVSISSNPVELSATFLPKSSVTAAGALNSTTGPSLSAASTSMPSTSTGEVPPTIEEPTPDAAPPHVPPTAGELKHATPHPSALYCRRHHGWVIIAVTTASPTASHISAHWCPDPDKKSLLNKLPDSALRTEKNCSESESPANNAPPYRTLNWTVYPQEQKIHHFHRYANVVAGSGLYPPLKRPNLSPNIQTTSNTVPESSEDVEMASESQDLQGKAQEDEFRSSWEQAPTSEYMDLYLCCQCRTQIVCSPDGNVIPGIVPVSALERLIQERSDNPRPGQTKEQSVFGALETLIRIVEEPLWLGNLRPLRTTGKAFNNKIGWNDFSRRIFESIGFTVEDDNLTPPTLETTTAEGRASRLKLLRTWVELNAVLAEYSSRYPKFILSRPSYIRLTNIRESLSVRFGSHPDKMPRVEDISAVATIPQHIWDTLGITRSTATPTVVKTAYQSQLRCDPSETPTYYDTICTLSRQSQFPNVSSIESLVATESSKGRWSSIDLHNAAHQLGFGSDNVIGAEYIPEEIDDDYIISAFQAAHRLASVDAVKRTNVKNSLRILAEARKSTKLMKHYEQIMAPNYMDIEEAYKFLEVNRDVDDDTLVVVYQVRIDDSPYSKERMQAALSRVAEERNSTRLKELAQTGMDPGKPLVVVPQEYPRGLQQLGNTCYLNSLLQYFYTIKELREVIENGRFDLDMPISDEDLLKHRIGGRLVSRREVERSKKFVKLLSGLFTQMMCADDPAITPEIELAKLALVTSKDEEDDAAAQNITTEPGEITDNPAGATNTTEVLKDTSTEANPTESMDTDLPAQADAPPTDTEQPAPPDQDAVMESRPVSPPQVEVKDKPEMDEEMHRPPAAMIMAPTDQIQVPDADEDKAQKADTSGDSMFVEMGDDPPSDVIIPTLKKPTMIPDSGAMMFGKQHDVSEVFDNCMFQIETALRFEKPDDADDAGSGTIKKLFYGKLLQRLSPISDPTASPTSSRIRAATVHEKEDLFSHLLVNVSDEGFDLYDGLSGYFEDEVEHGGKRSKMEVSLLDIPPILQIQLQRVQFNRETMQAFKSNAYVKFEETLVMDRFLANVDAEKKVESKKMELELLNSRERLRTLTQGDNNKLTTSIAGAKEFLSSLKKEHHEIDDELIAHLGDEITWIEEEITQTRTRCQQLKEQIEAFWKDERQAEYQLASVFIHRGTSPSFGHYFFYSRYLPEKPDEWFKYNDSEVTAVSKNEVLADGTGSTANPYLLVYVRKGHDVIDTIHRVAVSE